MDKITPNSMQWKQTPATANRQASSGEKPIFAAANDQVSITGSPATPVLNKASAHNGVVNNVAATPVAGNSTPQTATLHNTASPVRLTLEGPVTPLVNRAASSIDAVTALSEEIEDAQVIRGDSEDKSVWVPSASSTLVHTPKTKENMERLAAAISSGEFTLLTGETGAGKTAVVKYMAHLTNSPLRRVNLHDQTDEVELFGGYKPGADGGFVWKDGTITSAIRHGHWLLLDELNLADQAVLERMNPLLDGDGYIVLTEKEDKERVQVHPNTRIFATQNPASYEGRKELSAAMFDRFQRKIYMRRLPDNELVEVLRKDFQSDSIVEEVASKVGDVSRKAKKVLRSNILSAKDDITVLSPNTVRNLEAVVGNSDKKTLKEVMNGVVRGMNSGKSTVEILDSLPIAPKTRQILDAYLQVAAAPPEPIIEDSVLLQMSMFHNKMVESAETRLIGKKGGPYPFTLRDLLKLSKRIKQYHAIDPTANQFQLAWSQARDVYMDRFMLEADRQKVDNFLQTFFGDPKINRAGEPVINRTLTTMQTEGDKLRVGDTLLNINPDGGPYVPTAKSKLVPTPGTVKKLNRLARGVAMDEPILLVGPTAAGKTSLVRWLAHETNNEFRRVNLSNHTDTSELIGGFYPAVEIDFELAKKAVNAIENDAAIGPKFKETVAALGQEVQDGVAELKAGNEDAQDGVREAIGLILSNEELRDHIELHGDEAMKMRKDLEGAFRTVAGKFEWRDGIIVTAMKKGQWIVLDEINLAEPAVLEGLNSLLDGDRSLVLTAHLGEKVKAHSNFRAFGTMNPATSEYGGRKKLSPAMRNRFTESWFPEILEKSEVQLIATTWIEDFKEDAKKTLKEFRDLKASGVKPNRQLQYRALAAQAFMKADTSNLAETVTDFQLKMKEKSNRQGGQTPELPTAKKDGYHYTLRGMRSFLKYIKANVGLPKKNPDDPSDKSLRKDLKDVFREGVVSYFADGLSRPEDQQSVQAMGEEYAERL